jgi:predicted nucleic acid-binding protein
MGWVDSLRGNVVGLDTTPLIYFTEKNPVYIEIVRPFFKAISNKEFEVATSIVTLLEVLVLPKRDGDLELAQRYRDFLLETDNVTTHLLTQSIAEEAARLRAFYTIRTPDSIQMATAIHASASLFLTNDVRLPSLPNLKVLTLKEIIKTSQEEIENNLLEEGQE